MLVLTRKSGERVHIGDGIIVQVVAVHRRRVRLGITCPDDVAVRRSPSKETPVKPAVSTDEPPIGIRRRRSGANVC
ncbi:MAG: carbon storage regulator [Planctomycetaceae bacterium]